MRSADSVGQEQAFFEVWGFGSIAPRAGLDPWFGLDKWNLNGGGSADSMAEGVRRRVQCWVTSYIGQHSNTGCRPISGCRHNTEDEGLRLPSTTYMAMLGR